MDLFPAETGAGGDVVDGDEFVVVVEFVPDGEDLGAVALDLVWGVELGLGRVERVGPFGDDGTSLEVKDGKATEEFVGGFFIGSVDSDDCLVDLSKEPNVSSTKLSILDGKQAGEIEDNNGLVIGVVGLIGRDAAASCEIPNLESRRVMFVAIVNLHRIPVPNHPKIPRAKNHLFTSHKRMSLTPIIVTISKNFIDFWCSGLEILATLKSFEEGFGCAREWQRAVDDGLKVGAAEMVIPGLGDSSESKEFGRGEMGEDDVGDFGRETDGRIHPFGSGLF